MAGNLWALLQSKLGLGAPRKEWELRQRLHAKSFLPRLRQRFMRPEVIDKGIISM